MLTLLKNLECYAPEHIGKNDILICAGKIYKIAPRMDNAGCGLIESADDCDGLLAFPGLIDQHVHIAGGGGEQGFSSRTSEMDATDILAAGVTTVVGLLGADGTTRSLESLYAKAKALEEQGLTTYIYTGSYSTPPVTLTGDIVRDLVLIDKVIGVGEIALSDHRGSHPDGPTLLKIASDAHLGGLLGKKAGVLHLHFGDGERGLAPLASLIADSDLPPGMFVPTHQNRSLQLLEQAVAHCTAGGRVDLTAGETAGVPVPDAVQTLMWGGADPSLVTVSSDAGGSGAGGGAGSIQPLLDDIVCCIRDKGLSPELAFSLVTQNPARLLCLYPRKGVLRQGSDADILITDADYAVKRVYCAGRLMLEK